MEDTKVILIAATVYDWLFKGRFDEFTPYGRLPEKERQEYEGLARRLIMIAESTEPESVASAIYDWTSRSVVTHRKTFNQLSEDSQRKYQELASRIVGYAKQPAPRIVYPAPVFQPPDTCLDCAAGVPFDAHGQHVK